MSATAEKDSEADILSEVIVPDAPTLSAEHARWLLSLRFTERQHARMAELLDKGNRGELTENEMEQLERYRRIGMMLNLAQAKARLSLKNLGLDF